MSALTSPATVSVDLPSAARIAFGTHCGHLEPYLKYITDETGWGYALAARMSTRDGVRVQLFENYNDGGPDFPRGWNVDLIVLDSALGNSLMLREYYFNGRRKTEREVPAYVLAAGETMMRGWLVLA